jgi:chromosomal replication initiator protein
MNYMTIPGLKRENYSFQACSIDEKAERIVTATCIYFNVSREKLFSKRRFTELTKPRSICQYLLVVEGKLSLKAVGRMMSGRDHTSIMHNRNLVKGQLSLKHDEEYKNHIKNIMSMV